jgi:hypothetical protein
MDKAVVIGLGLKYLLWTLPVAALVLWLLPRLLRRLPESADRYAILRNLRQGVLSNPEDENQKSWLERWIWLVCGSFVVSLLIVVFWLPVQARLSAGDDPVLKYLPHTRITAAASPPSTDSSGAALVSLTEPSYSETQNEQAVEPAVVEGVLLSHDEAYWYVFSEQGPSKGTVVAIPVTQTSEIRMMPEG